MQIWWQSARISCIGVTAVRQRERWNVKHMTVAVGHASCPWRRNAVTSIAVEGAHSAKPEARTWLAETTAKRQLDDLCICSHKGLGLCCVQSSFSTPFSLLGSCALWTPVPRADRAAPRLCAGFVKRCSLVLSRLPFNLSKTPTPTPTLVAPTADHDLSIKQTRRAYSVNIAHDSAALKARHGFDSGVGRGRDF